MVSRLPGLLLLWLAAIAPVSAATLAVRFGAIFDGESVRLDALRHLTGAGETLSIERLSLLLSEFALQAEDGTWRELDTVVYLDAASRRQRFALAEIPDGTFQTFRFSVGLNPALNHSDPAQYAADHPLNPLRNALHWSWQGGYIFMALEGRYRAAGETALQGFSLHLANDTNRTSVSLPLSLYAAAGDALTLSLDLARLLTMPEPISFARDGSSTHSREGDPLAALRRNLATAFAAEVHRGAPSVPTRLPETLQPLDLPAAFEPYPLAVDRRFPLPALPVDNPLIQSRVALGEALFHDARLSRDSSQSCATCHQADAAFVDRDLALSLGVKGRPGTRNSMPLFNLAWKENFFWDGRAALLREQVLDPIQHPLEMDADLAVVLERLRGDPARRAQFAAAFGSGEISADTLGRALETFLLTLTSFDSKFDRAMQGKAELTAQEKRGFELFMTESDPRLGLNGADCFHCHGGVLFTDQRFHNNGLEPHEDTGREAVTGRETDRGKFVTPSLRNIALTAPYMHDGRFESLEEVIDHYASRLHPSPTLDPNLAKHAGRGVPISKDDEAALVAYLRTLTDPQYLEALQP